MVFTRRCDGAVTAGHVAMTSRFVSGGRWETGCDASPPFSVRPSPIRARPAVRAGAVPDRVAGVGESAGRGERGAAGGERREEGRAERQGCRQQRGHRLRAGESSARRSEREPRRAQCADQRTARHDRVGHRDAAHRRGGACERSGPPRRVSAPVVRERWLRSDARLHHLGEHHRRRDPARCAGERDRLGEPAAGHAHRHRADQGRDHACPEQRGARAARLGAGAGHHRPGGDQGAGAGPAGRRHRGAQAGFTGAEGAQHGRRRAGCRTGA